MLAACPLNWQWQKFSQRWYINTNTRFLFQNTQLPSFPMFTFFPAANFCECEMLDLVSCSPSRGYDRGANPWFINFSVDFLVVLYLSVLHQNGYSCCSHKVSDVEGVRGRGLKSRRGWLRLQTWKSVFFIRNGTTSPSFHFLGFSTCGLGRSKLFSPIKSSTFPYSLHPSAMRVNNSRGS